MSNLNKQPSPLPYYEEIAERDDSVNSIEKVRQRQKLVALETHLKEGISLGELDDIKDDCTLSHYFIPDLKSGYCLYARELKMPKGAIVIGKIHKEQTLNILSQGKISLLKDGKKVYLEAPYTYVSEPGIQKAAYIEEDVTWLNIHITKHSEESKLPLIEDEVIAKTYTELGLIATEEELKLLSKEDKGEV